MAKDWTIRNSLLNPSQFLQASSNSCVGLERSPESLSDKNATCRQGIEYDTNRDYVRVLQCYQNAFAKGDTDAKVDTMWVHFKLGR